jgi:hypothetical protein
MQLGCISRITQHLSFGRSVKVADVDINIIVGSKDCSYLKNCAIFIYFIIY